MFAKDVYVKRRDQLRKLMGSGVVLLAGNSESPVNYADNCYAFRQDSSFLYYVGLDTPDLFYVLDIDNDKEYLFGMELTIDDIIWMGNLPSLQDRAATVGLPTVLPFTQLAETIQKAVQSGREVHYLKQYRHYNQMLLGEILHKNPCQVADGFSVKLTKAVIQMRLIKEADEIRELEIAGQIGYEMHLTAMKMCQPGRTEREIAGTIEGIAIAKGTRVSFPTILSQNGQTLHNHDHSGILTSGRLMLTDAGAESVNYYASDFTRTTAVGGVYSQKQKEIHDIVLKAINTGIEMARPGITYKSVHREAYRIIFDGLKALGLTKGDTEAALNAGAPALFMPHGLGHAMGIDVHDMEDLGETLVGYDDEITRDTMFGYKSLRFGKRLVPGHVLTVEPGIYFVPQLIDKWEAEKINAEFINFDRLKAYYDFGGIRLEDDILITENACRPLYDKRLPITTEEITAAVQG